MCVSPIRSHFGGYEKKKVGVTSTNVVGEEVKGVGVMNDDEIKLEEIETVLQKGKGLVVKKKHEPVCIRE